MKNAVKLLVLRNRKKPWIFTYDPLLSVFTYRGRKHSYYVDFSSGSVKGLGGEKDWVVRDVVRPVEFKILGT